MLMQKTIILIIFAIISLSFLSKGKTFRPGIYSLEIDYSWRIKLEIKSDSTFSFFEQRELGSSPSNEGNWKIKNQKLVLFNFKSKTKFDKIPSNWKIKKDKICSNYNGGICLSKKQ